MTSLAFHPAMELLSGENHFCYEKELMLFEAMVMCKQKLMAGSPGIQLDLCPQNVFKTGHIEQS